VANRRRFRLLDQWVEHVDVTELANRDGWRCHLCGKKVSRTAKWPNRKAPTVDHIIPVSLGGEHSYRNTALAHWGCNVDKQAEPRNEQLRLVG
jgi:5-methylcytosine-specific restriction endonuclease McrA